MTPWRWWHRIPFAGRVQWWWTLASVPILCDGCDRVRRFTTSRDGRTIACPRCHWRAR